MDYKSFWKHKLRDIVEQEIVKQEEDIILKDFQKALLNWCNNVNQIIIWRIMSNAQRIKNVMMDMIEMWRKHIINLQW